MVAWSSRMVRGGPPLSWDLVRPLRSAPRPTITTSLRVSGGVRRFATHLAPSGLRRSLGTTSLTKDPTMTTPAFVARQLVAPIRRMKARQSLRLWRSFLLADLRRALRALDASLPGDLEDAGLRRVAEALARLHIEIDAACAAARREES
jgi:hypothetical protein